MGYKIKEFREKMNLSQQELADKAGVSRVTIALLESNRQNTTTKTLIKIAAALNTTVDQIFFEAPVQPTVQS